MKLICNSIRLFGEYIPGLLIKNDFFHFLSSQFDWEWAFKLVINFIRNARKLFVIIEKIKKYRKCPALDLTISKFLTDGNFLATHDLHGDLPAARPRQAFQQDRNW